MAVKRGVFDVPEAAVVDFAPDPSYTLDLQHMVKDVRVPSHALADVQKKTQDIHGPGIGF